MMAAEMDHRWSMEQRRVDDLYEQQLRTFWADWRAKIRREKAEARELAEGRARVRMQRFTRLWEEKRAAMEREVREREERERAEDDERHAQWEYRKSEAAKAARSRVMS